MTTLTDRVYRKLYRAAPHPLGNWMRRDAIVAAIGRVPSIAQARVYVITEDELPELKAGLDRLERKLKRIDIAQRSRVEHLGSEDRVVRDETGREPDRVVREHFYRVLSDVEAVVPGGWRLLGVIDHLYDDNGVANNLVRTYPGARLKIPVAYRTAAATCDHCKIARSRTETFVVADESGNIRRVGRQCLKDYVGDLSASTILALTEGLRAIQAVLEEREAEGADPLGQRSSRFALSAFLAASNYAIRNKGFVSRTNAMERGLVATADEVLEYFDNLKKGRTNRLTTPADYERARTVTEWAQGIDPLTESEYLGDLRTLAHVGSVRLQDAGKAASMIVAYDRAQARAAEQSTQSTEYVGTVGEKFGTGRKDSPPLKVRIERVITTRVDLDRLYIINMKAENGAQLIAFMDTLPALAVEGAELWVTGRVKSHQTDKKYGAQTVLTRVDFLETWEPPPPPKTRRRSTATPPKPPPEQWFVTLRTLTKTEVRGPYKSWSAANNAGKWWENNRVMRGVDASFTVELKK